MARVYSATDVGLATSLLSATTVISMLSLLGFGSSFVRFLPKSVNRDREISSGLIAAGTTALIGASIYVLLIPQLASKLEFVRVVGLGDDRFHRDDGVRRGQPADRLGLRRLPRGTLQLLHRRALPERLEARAAVRVRGVGRVRHLLRRRRRVDARGAGERLVPDAPLRLPAEAGLRPHAVGRPSTSRRRATWRASSTCCRSSSCP